MKQPEYSPLEALERIKLMMKYDMSKTLNENKEVIFEQPTKVNVPRYVSNTTQALSAANIAKNAVAAGTTATGLAAAGTTATGLATAGTTATGLAGAGGAGGLGLGAAALAAAPWVAGAAVVGGLAYWMYDSINNGMPTASKVESFFNSCSTQDKNLKQVASDSELITAAESINGAIEGLGTNEGTIKSAIESMSNVADLCALKSKYDARFGNLYEDLDGDIDGTDWKTYVWAPMQTIIEKSLQELPVDCTKTPNDPKCKKTGGVKYKSCSGTYTQGCYSEVIKKVQGCLGGLVTDGKFGSKTNEKLKAAGFSSGFSDNDVDKICNNPEDGSEEITVDTTNTDF
jgi:hypothetical protein